MNFEAVDCLDFKKKIHHHLLHHTTALFDLKRNKANS